MITKNDAVAIGKAIVQACAKECANAGTGGASTNPQIYGARGSAIYAIDNLWYDVLKPNIRAKFGYSNAEFYNAIGWNDL